MSIIRYHGDNKSATRQFMTSLSEGSANHVSLAGIGRGHGAVENKNPWKKDTTLWRADCAVRRNAILALILTEEYPSLNQAFLHCADH